MPEINNKKMNQKKKSSPSSSSKKKTNSKSPTKKSKSRQPISGVGISWESKEKKKEETKVSTQQMYMVIGAIFLFFLFILWAFVDDRPEWQRQAAQREYERRQNESMAQRQEREARSAALSAYNFADLLNSTSFSQSLQLMQSGEDDRLMVVSFDDSSREEAGGNVFRIRLFKKMDGIAKRLPTHKLFKRYEEEDLPRFVLFDCGNPEDGAAENVCKQIVGENVPNILIFRPGQQPRAFPNDLKSDKDIIKYLYNLMQPAVKYIEELAEAEDFVSDDSELHCFLFSRSTDMDAINVYDTVSDSLRDFGVFARSKNPTVIESFDLDETQLPTLLIWRTFGENPQIFTGNITSRESVRDFVMNNYVPIFGEFTPLTSRRFMKRGLPILWVAYNNKMSDDTLQLLLNSVLSIAKRYRGQLTFVQLDADAQPGIAENFGLQSSGKKKGEGEEDGERDEEDEEEEEDEEGESNLPQVFIMNQIAQIKEKVNMDDIEGTVQKVIDEYLLQLRIQRGDVMPELHDTVQLDDENEFEEDDDEEDDEEEDDGDDEEEEEQEAQQEEKGKTDL